jgi:predicted helicase
MRAKAPGFAGGYLHNPTFKGMRKSLMATFDQLYIIDLHGNSRKKERAPDGSEDKNVFDIEQGVAISLFIKLRESERLARHAEIWGTRQAKYEWAASSSVRRINWTNLSPGAPDWLLRPRDEQLAQSYRKFWSIPAIFSAIGDPAPGIVTTQDEFAISFSPEEAINKVRRLMDTSSEEEARRLYRLCSQRQWNYSRAKVELRNVNLKSAVAPLVYRPFDNRWTVWDRNVAVHRRERVMRHMLKPNISLMTARSNKSPNPDHFFVADRSSETKAAESTIQSYVFPLFIYSDNGDRNENISSELRTFIDSSYKHHYTPEEILGYIYAIVYAPTYRARYAEFLRTDFPRVPFPQKAKDFERLSLLGWALVQAHLLRQVPRRSLAAYHGRGEHEVEFVRCSTEDQSIAINKTQSFRPVPQPVWDFHIGGYQVLDKYLKSRKGRTLSLDEINHVSAVADSLAFTIDQMVKIDEAYLAAFPDRG